MRLAYLARHQYMLAFTGVALVVAAVGTGAFDLQTTRARPQPPPRVAQVPTPITYTLTPTAPTLVITFFLVESEEQRAVLNTVEDVIIFREVLKSTAMEVLIAGTPEEEAEARRQIEAAMRSFVAARFVIEDLRGRF